MKQSYPHWEVCLVADVSTSQEVSRLIQEHAARDPRIRLLRLSGGRNVVDKANSALAMASGEYIGFLGQDDTLSPDALYEVVKLMNESPESDIIYSDEDRILPSSDTRTSPNFKPDWSPDTFLSLNYLRHFVVIRKALVDQVGGFRRRYEGAQDYELLLRAAQRTNKIRHASKVLYHWRISPEEAAKGDLSTPNAVEAERQAIRDVLQTRGVDANVIGGKVRGSHRVKYAIKGSPRVSVVIVTPNSAQALNRCVSSILEKTDYKALELVIVNDLKTEPSVRELLGPVKSDARIHFRSYDKPLTSAALSNWVVRSLDADVILFLDASTEVISAEWMSSMLEMAQREEVGAVGAKLYRPDDTIQHGGIVIGLEGIAGYAHKDLPGVSDGYMGRLNLIQNMSAVSGACLMTRKAVFDEVGGFDERLVRRFTDVDLCLKIRRRGYWIVWTPYAELYQHDVVSGGHGVDAVPCDDPGRQVQEAALMRAKWGETLALGDPYYSPNLAIDRIDFSIGA